MTKLMEVPGSFWGPNPGLYARYLTVVRAGAAARRRLPLEQRMTFWGPLDLETVRRSTHGRPDDPSTLSLSASRSPDEN